MNPDRAVQEVVPTVTGKGMFAVLHAVCGGFYPVGVSGAVRLFLRLKFVVLQYLKNCKDKTSHIKVTLMATGNHFLGPGAPVDLFLKQITKFLIFKARLTRGLCILASH